MEAVQAHVFFAWLPENREQWDVQDVAGIRTGQVSAMCLYLLSGSSLLSHLNSTDVN